MIIESLKIMPPFIANGNTASPIIGKTFVVWIGASLNDAYPNSVNGMFSHAMSRTLARSDLLLQAATRFCVSRGKVISQWSRHVAAVALTQPNNAFLVFANWPKRDKATKSLAGNIFSFFGENDKLGLHRNLPFGVRPRTFAALLGYFCRFCIPLIIPQHKQEEHIGYAI